MVNEFKAEVRLGDVIVPGKVIGHRVRKVLVDTGSEQIWAKLTRTPNEVDALPSGFARVAVQVASGRDRIETRHLYKVSDACFWTVEGGVFNFSSRRILNDIE